MVVADGMGGAAAGERASALAVESVKDLRPEHPQVVPPPRPGRRERRCWPNSGRAWRSPTRRSSTRPRPTPGSHGMGTTLTMAYSVGDDLYIAHAGDSRAYLFRDGKLEQVTNDHTLVQLLVSGGVITPEDAKHHARRNIVTNVIGGPNAGVHAEIHKVRLVDGDVLLLCSDGLTEPVEDAQIAEVLGSEHRPRGRRPPPDRPGPGNGGPDNVTAVVARYSIAAATELPAPSITNATDPLIRTDRPGRPGRSSSGSPGGPLRFPGRASLSQARGDRSGESRENFVGKVGAADVSWMPHAASRRHLPRRARLASIQPRSMTIRSGHAPGDGSHGRGLADRPGRSRADPGRGRPAPRAQRPGDPPEPTWTAEQRQHWSFVPPVRPEPPAVDDRAWVRNPIDAFILKPIEEAGLAPAPEADRATLIRRLRFDLTGLPPSPEEVAAFVADPAPDAYERLVDRLLGLAPVRRAVGPALARPRPVRRDRRVQERQGPAQRLALSRLGRQGPQRRPALRPVRRPPARRRRDRPRRPRRLHRHRVQPELAVRGQQHGPRPEPAVDARRHDRHDDLGRPRPDRRLRPLPRPQVRPDQPEGLLPDPGPLLRQPGPRTTTSSPRPRTRRSHASVQAEHEARVDRAPPRDRGDREAVRRRAPQGQARQAPRGGPAGLRGRPDGPDGRAGGSCSRSTPSR